LQADLSLDRAAPRHLEDQPWLVGHVPSVASSSPNFRDRPHGCTPNSRCARQATRAADQSLGFGPRAPRPMGTLRL
jgi:hypothetical protein